MEEFDFGDLTPVEIPVRVAGEQYVLREASEGTAVKYRNVALRAARMVDGKVTGMDGLADAEPLLVSLCLFKTNGNGARVPVHLETVLSWPPRVVRPLYEKAKQISGLGEEGDQKKSPGSTTPTSSPPASGDGPSTK